MGFGFEELDASSLGFEELEIVGVLDFEETELAAGLVLGFEELLGVEILGVEEVFVVDAGLDARDLFAVVALAFETLFFLGVSGGLDGLSCLGCSELMVAPSPGGLCPFFLNY